MSLDLVSVIEAAYAAERSDIDWLQRLVELASAELDRGLGAYACPYDVTSGSIRFGEGASVRMSDATLRAVRESSAFASPEVAARMFRAGPTYSAGSTAYGQGNAAWKAGPAIANAIALAGAADADAVVTGDPSGVGCILMFPKHAIGPVPRATGTLWSRIAAHMAAGFRLRRGSASADAEAILSPSGRVEHAEVAAQGSSHRAALTDSAKRMALARGALRRRSPSEAVETWRALVAGQWSLVDHFDHDGRRFLLARRNEPTPAVTLAGLSSRQRAVLSHAAMGHSNKLIGYELGLTPSAVAMILTRAARTLGVRTRVQLIAAYQRALGERGRG